MIAERRETCDVLIYVQHLLGTGHVQRAAAIARAAARAGLDTILVSGGLPVPGLDAAPARLVQLDPVRTRDETFAVLVDTRGEPIDQAFKAARRDALCALFQRARPRLLVTEMFPFGRRQMRFELLPLIKRAREADPRPPILCSLRDVLTTHKEPGKTEWMLDVFNRFFDFALVHGDPDVIPLERSLPRAVEIADRLRYTGYVLAQSVGPPGPRGGETGAGELGAGEVIVSTGGGAVAGPLIEAALAARALGPLAEVPWRILVGHNMADAAFHDVVRRAPSGVAVERARPDFRALLARARLSISQAGYNTLLEVLAARVPAVVVPFARAGETEQGLRAREFAARGLVTVVDDAELSPGALAGAIRDALARPPAGLAAIRADGAAQTARILRAMTNADRY